MARWISVAATVESTPPDSAAHHAAVADLRRMRADRLVDERRDGPVAGAAADVEREVAQDLLAALGVRDFRMEQQRVVAALRALPSPPPARWRWSPRPRNPGGAAATKSPWLAHTRRSSGRSVEACATRRRRLATSRRIAELAMRRRCRPCRRACRSSAACRSRCRASARRDRSTRGSHCGAPSSSTLSARPTG